MSPSTPDPNGEFEHAITAIEQSLADLKARYQAVQTAEQHQIDLLDRRAQIQANPAKSPEIPLELQQIETELEALEFTLESKLFSVSEYFWRVVRFVGLGLVIGWSLAFYVIKNPTSPTPEPTQLNLSPNPKP